MPITAALLVAARRESGRWRAFVRYSVGVGQTHIACVDQDQLRYELSDAVRDHGATSLATGRISQLEFGERQIAVAIAVNAMR